MGAAFISVLIIDKYKYDYINILGMKNVFNPSNWELKESHEETFWLGWDPKSFMIRSRNEITNLPSVNEVQPHKNN